MRLLVTGAAGYLGHAVVGELADAGFDVIAAAHRAAPSVRRAVEVRYGDLLEPGAARSLVRGVGAVVHLVALARVREAAADPLRYYAVNVVGTLNLLEALAMETERTGVPARLVFSSTGAVYGTPDRQPIVETSPVMPLNPYAGSKVTAENAIKWQAMTGVLGAVTLRIFNAAGGCDGHADPDQSRIIPKVAAVASGRDAELKVNGDGTAIRDFVHVADIARAVALSIEAATPGTHDLFNVGATPASVQDIVRAAEGIVGGKVPIRHVPADARESPVLMADTAKLRAELGWAPMKSDLAQLVNDQLSHAQRVP